MEVEMITFVCSACGKRSTALVKDEMMTCRHCKEVFVRQDGDDEKWLPKTYLEKKRKEKK